MTMPDLAKLVATAQARVILAVPSLTDGLGEVLVAAHHRLPGRVLVIVDPDERVYRVGYGVFQEIKEAYGKGMPMLARHGLRMGCCLIDEVAFFLTQPPQLVEAPTDPEVHAVNAVRVEPQIVLSFLRGIANGPDLDDVLSPDPELHSEAQEDILDRLANSKDAAVEAPKALPITDEVLAVTETSLALAPPMDFQVHRQSMVYTSLLLYVVVELTACRLDNREIVVNKALLPLLGEKTDIVGRRSFQLKVDGDLSGLAEIRRRTDILRTKTARSLGKPYGTVLLRRDLESFEAERKAIEALIELNHPEAITAFQSGLAPQVEDICHICLEQCLHTMNDQDIIQALCPKTKDKKEVARWERWRDTRPSRPDMAVQLEFRNKEALWDNVHQMMKQLTKPKLEVTIREFTLQQMNENEFTGRLLSAFHDKKDLAPFLEDRAVIGKRAKAGSDDSLGLFDEEPAF
jgi:hypothetical protein